MKNMMSGAAKCLFLVLITSFQSCLCLAFTTNAEGGEVYIVHTAANSPDPSITNLRDWHMSLMASVLPKTESGSPETEKVESRFVYHYQTVMQGFAAILGTEEEADNLRGHPDVLGLYKSELCQLHTTRTPQFLGLERVKKGRRDESAWPRWKSRDKNLDGVIIGVLDSGIWPESESFLDAGKRKPIPPQWRGVCETGMNFSRSNCNTKLIGARAFSKGYLAGGGKFDKRIDYLSPRDASGHGSHTASTAAGAYVPDASLFGLASGTARGMAVWARIAAYKVCWSDGCATPDVVAAMDQAVADGVDILSMSLAEDKIVRYDVSPFGIAAFGAMEKGVFISMSAANLGPDPLTIQNVSPWVMTVAASTIDRDFLATVTLGMGNPNSTTLTGVSLYNNNNHNGSRSYPLVYFAKNQNASLCMKKSLGSRNQVAGKIVLCDQGINPRVEKGQVVKDAGGAGMILANTKVYGESLVADAHVLPAVAVGNMEGEMIRQYALKDLKPTASLAFKGTVTGVKPSPIIAAFSSRGPNPLALEVLKPDVTAPGVNIIAAWSGSASPTTLSTDARRVKFNIISGTSMSCPHVSGVAALIKASHPDWSPAAVKSALMTTAYVKNTNRESITDASTGMAANADAYGAGHISPNKAMDPGLVYDLTAQDYLDFICSMNLDPRKFSSKLTCSRPFKPASDLNYPAISVVFRDFKSRTIRVRRTVTNVGLATSNYSVVVTRFEHASVTVIPKTLEFTKKFQKQSYVAVVSRRASSVSKQDTEFGELVWRDGKHEVRSPVIIYHNLRR